MSPAGKRFDLGDIVLDDLVPMLDKHRIYQEVVGKEVAENSYPAAAAIGLGIVVFGGVIG